MPTISRFHGIVIRMHWTDHPPPHFHAFHGEHQANIDIRTLQVIDGHLPSQAASLVRQWAALHQAALEENWDLCVKKQTVKPIPPLR